MKRLSLSILLLTFAALAGAQPITYSTGVRNDTANVLVSNSGLTQVMVINTTPMKRVSITCKATGQALSAFALAASPDNNFANPVTFASLAADYSTPVAPVIRTVGTPVTLAAAATAMVVVDVGGFDNLYVYATSGNAAGTQLQCWSSGS